MSDKYDIAAVALIVKQTNYTDKEAQMKLEQWEGNYINVIKEYLNPNFNKKKKEKETRRVNQQMMYEIRNFMDDANMQFLNRKKKEEKKQEYIKKVYKQFLDTKKLYPDCVFNPPSILTCNVECKNPMCPGYLDKNKKYQKA